MQSIDTLRDLRLFKLDRKRILVVSCDSAGGIGPKPFDNVRVSGSVVGKFTARVALMEALSVGALPFCVTVSLSVEPQPTGAQILNGIRSELRHASLTIATTLHSSEKNFAVKQTGLGITILSIASPRSLRMKACERGDAVMAIGRPQVGEEVVSGERNRNISDTKDVRTLLKIPFVHEILPVGSQGILHEAQILAKESGLKLSVKSELSLDILKSAGPATVTLCAIPNSRSELLRREIGKHVSAIGTLC
jgi:hypothetical protein